MDMVVTLKKCYYFKFWIIHVQSFTNIPKSMWKLVFNVFDVIFYLKVLKGKLTKSRWIMVNVKFSKTYSFGTKKLKNKQKLQIIWTYENMVKINHSKVPNYQIGKVFK
jgi:hypothetical protein